MLVTEHTNIINAAEISMPLASPMESDLSNIEDTLGYILLNLTYSNISLIYPTIVEQMEILRITQLWQISLSALNAGFLLVLIFAIVWSKTT
ncbi:MAG: hypothetical protein FWE05_13720 [Defluviitaleaceae bacterium]|nr:hypothetical protein [Defluviitaleaceae bacterium]